MSQAARLGSREGGLRAPRILFVDHTGEPGGGQLGLRRFVAHPSLALRVGVVFLSGGGVAQDIAAAGIECEVLPDRGRRSVIREIVGLASVLRGKRADLMVANSLRAALVLAMLPIRRRRLAVYVREDVSLESIGRLKSVVIGRLVLPRFGLIIVNSESTRSSIPGPSRRRRSAELAYPVSGIDAAPGVETGREAVAEKRDRRTFRVLSLSRLQPWKGIDLLIQAVTEVRRTTGLDVELTIAGGGGLSDAEYERRLHTLAEPLGPSVNFVGHVDDVGELLREHHVLCVCSRSPEAFGQVVPQALAWGVPVVAPDAGGPREILAPGRAGRLFVPGSAESLAEKLHELAADRQAWAQLATAAPTEASRFSDEVTVERLAEILDNHLRRTRGSETP